MLLLLPLACGPDPATEPDDTDTVGGSADTGAADTGTAPATGDTAADTGTAAPFETVWLAGPAQGIAGGRVSARDLDGDGLAELAVGGREAAWVLSGPYADGPLDQLADWTAATTYTVELLPDLTGDGIGDLMLESWFCGAEIHAGPFPAGAVPDPYATLWGPEADETYTLCGDADGDGDPDLCVGSNPNCEIYAVEPAVLVYALPLPPAALGAEHALVSIEAGGLDVEAGAVDLDGDGRDEIVVSAPEAASDGGQVWLVRDPPLGAFDLAQAAAAWTGTASGEAGSELARGDLDGDGRDDLVIAAPRFEDPPGYYARPTGRVYVATDEAGGPLPGASITLVAGEVGGQFGAALAVGDLDGDGAPDLAISQIERTPPGPGRVAIHLGPLAAGVQTEAEAAAVFEGWGPNDYYGADLAAADLDGDGRDDLAVGGTGDFGGASRSGAVHLVSGAAVLP